MAEEEDNSKLDSSDELMSSFLSTDDMAGLARQLLKFITQAPNIFGGADIYNVRFQRPITLAGMLIAVLTCLVDTDRKPAVHKFVVLAPPGSNAEDCEVEVWSWLVTTFSLLAKRDMEQRELDRMKSCFQLIVASDQRTSSILNLISVQPGLTSIIIVDAASYRDYDIELNLL